MLEKEGKEEAKKKVKEMRDAKADMEVYRTRLQKRKKMKSVLEEIESSSDEEAQEKAATPVKKRRGRPKKADPLDNR